MVIEGINVVHLSGKKNVVVALVWQMYFFPYLKKNIFTIYHFLKSNSPMHYELAICPVYNFTDCGSVLCVV